MDESQSPDPLDTLSHRSPPSRPHLDRGLPTPPATPKKRGGPLGSKNKKKRVKRKLNYDGDSSGAGKKLEGPDTGRDEPGGIAQEIGVECVSLINERGEALEYIPEDPDTEVTGTMVPIPRFRRPIVDLEIESAQVLDSEYESVEKYKHQLILERATYLANYNAAEREMMSLVIKNQLLVTELKKLTAVVKKLYNEQQI